MMDHNEDEGMNITLLYKNTNLTLYFSKGSLVGICVCVCVCVCVCERERERGERERERAREPDREIGRRRHAENLMDFDSPILTHNFFFAALCHIHIQGRTFLPIQISALGQLRIITSPGACRPVSMIDCI